jgi:hypothetical protein
MVDGVGSADRAAALRRPFRLGTRWPAARAQHVSGLRRVNVATLLALVGWALYMAHPAAAVAGVRSFENYTPDQQTGITQWAERNGSLATTPPCNSACQSLEAAQRDPQGAWGNGSSTRAGLEADLIELERKTKFVRNVGRVVGQAALAVEAYEIGYPIGTELNEHILRVGNSSPARGRGHAMAAYR